MPAIRPHEKLKEAIKQRKKEGQIPWAASTRILAEELSRRSQEEVSDTRLRTFLSSGEGRFEHLLSHLEDILYLGRGFLENFNKQELPALPDRHLSTNIVNAGGQRGLLVAIKIYRGGSSRVFLMNGEDAETIEVYIVPGEERTYVRIADGSLMRSVNPSQIVFFDRRDHPIIDKTLLVCRKGNRDECAIRVYDPEQFGGGGGYVDPKGVEEPLPVSEWDTRGIAKGILAEDGLLLGK